MMAKGILLDIGKLMPVLDAFTDLTNIRVGYFSANGSQIIGQMRPVSSFCQRIKSTEVGSGRCLQCDRQAVQHVRNQALITIFTGVTWRFLRPLPLYIDNNTLAISCWDKFMGRHPPPAVGAG